MPAQHQTEQLEIPDVTLPQLLEKTVQDFPQNPALEYYGATLKYQDLRRLVRRFAAALIRLGVRPGDRVAIMLPNMPQAVIAFYGTLYVGGIAVMVNPLYTARELSHQLQDSGAKILVTLDLLYNRTVREALKTHPVEHVIAAAVHDYMPFHMRAFFPLKAWKDGLKIGLPVRDTMHRFRPVIDGRAGAPLQATDPGDVAVLQYTGGTTGQAKGAMLTHRNLVANVHQVQAIVPNLRLGEERVLAVLPLFHVYGLTVIMNIGIAVGASLILLPQFVPKNTLDVITKLKPSFFPGAPPLYSALLRQKDLDQYDLSSIRYCISGAAPLPFKVQEEFEARTGGILVEGYGLTEASPVTHANPVDRERRRPGTVGLPLPLTESRIVSMDDPATEVAPGEQGELAVRGPQVMKGYWQRPEETAQVLKDGWLYTGDIATVDEDGYVSIVDRKKDLILVGGYSVYPREVEEVLYQHPDVVDAAVVGREHATRGELIIAYVVLRDGAEISSGELREHCLQNLANYKVPRRFKFKDRLPKSLAGKVLRRVLREEEVDEGDAGDDAGGDAPEQEERQTQPQETS